MSITTDALREIGGNHGWPICEEAADEIDDLERAYALLFEENSSLKVELATLRQERTAWRVTAENAEAAVKQARIDALEEAKRVVDDETLTDPQDASDDAYNAAVYDCVRAIRSLKETP